MKKRILSVPVDIGPESPHRVWNPESPVGMVCKKTTWKNPESKACIDLILFQERQKGLLPVTEETDNSKSIPWFERMEMDKRLPGSHPRKPIDLDSLQKLFPDPLALLGEYEDPMPPVFQSFDEGQEKRSLDKIIGMRGEGRRNDAKVQMEFPSYFSSLLYSMSNHIAKNRD